MAKEQSVSLEYDAAAEADALLREEDENLQMHKLNGNGSGTERPKPSTTLEDLEDTESLPPPATMAVNANKKVHPAPIICIWIVLSSSVIVLNAYILADLEFPFPIFLTTVHLVYATIGTRVLQRFTHLLDGVANVEMSWDRWLKNIVPIGALFSASLIFSNLAYLTLSISFIQMLKAFTAVAVLGLSVLMGLEKMNPRTFIVVGAISFGVALASVGEIDFVLGGFIFQSLGILFEATRLVAIQKLLQGLRMDPLVSLYYYAPVCATFNALLIPIFEGSKPFYQVMDRVGPFTLFINANVAFLLNVAVVFLIGCASSLVLTLSGVIKDILLVSGSVILFGSTVTFTQMVGYSIALIGLFVFKTSPDVMQVYIAKMKATIGR